MVKKKRGGKKQPLHAKNQSNKTDKRDESTSQGEYKEPRFRAPSLGVLAKGAIGVGALAVLAATRGGPLTAPLSRNVKNDIQDGTSKETYLELMGLKMEAMRANRLEYRAQPTSVRETYNKIAMQTLGCFLGQQSTQPFNLEKIISDCHQCMVDKAYPNTKTSYDGLGDKIEEKRARKVIQQDITRHSFGQEVPYIGNSNGVYTLPLSGVKVEVEIASPQNVLKTKVLAVTNSKGEKTEVDNIAFENTALGTQSYVTRAALVQHTKTPAHSAGDCDKSTLSEPLDLCLRGAGQYVLGDLNGLGSRIINNEYKDKNEAVDLMAEFSYLQKLFFAREDERGSSFIYAAIETLFEQKIAENLLGHSLDSRSSPKVDPHLKPPKEIRTETLAMGEMLLPMIDPREGYKLTRDRIKEGFKRLPEVPQAKKERNLGSFEKQEMSRRNKKDTAVSLNI